MAIKRICYWTEKREHVRIANAFTERNGVQQLIICPSFVRPDITNIKKRKYHSAAIFKMQIKTYRPNIVCLSNQSEAWIGKFRKYGMKVAFIHHGEHDLVTEGNKSDLEQWLQYDIIFTGTRGFKTIMSDAGYKNKPIIVTNALPQYDTLYNCIKNNKKNRIEIEARCPGVKKIITLFGHSMGKAIFAAANKHFYDTIFMLKDLAEKNNWLIIVKPKKDDVSWCLNNMVITKQLPEEYIKKFDEIKNSKHVYFVSYAADPYVFHCSDAILCTGRSTTHIEACLSKVPLGLIGFDNYIIDTLNIASVGAANIFTNPDSFENDLKQLLQDVDMKNKQDVYIKKVGLTFDGKMHERLVDALLKL
jgi:hypothetical protein